MRSWLLASAFLCGCGGQVSDNGLVPTSSFVQCPAADAGNGVFVREQTFSPWLLKSPRINLVFWGKFWTNNTLGLQLSQQLTQEWVTLANDPQFYQLVSVYGIGKGTFGGTSYANPNVASGQLQESDIQQELTKEIDNGSLPSTDTNSLYLIMLPQGTQSSFDVANSYNGSHNLVGNIAYAHVEFNTNSQQMGFVSSHEIYESATDPGVGTGFVWNTLEIGDLCEREKFNAWSLDGYLVARIWDQRSCQCVP